jgi:hypothetical protein
VADRTGDAFVWERGAGGDEYAVRADGGALCVTNHLLHRHRDPADLPADNAETMLTYQRYRTISERSAGPSLSGESMREALDAVRAHAATDTPYPIRTLWRSLFDLDRMTMATHFYPGGRRGRLAALQPGARVRRARAPAQLTCSGAQPGSGASRRRQQRERG